MAAMKIFNDADSSSKSPRWRRVPLAVWNWLIEPSASVVESEGRLQARLLTALLLILILIGSLSMILSLFGVYSQPGEPETVGLRNLWITAIATLVMAVEYGLSRTVHYPLAAGLVVMTVFSATFSIVITNPENPQYLYFLVIGGLLGSLFLSARMTAIIFAITLLGMLFPSIFVAGLSTSHYLTAFVFILTVGGLVVMASILRQRYLERIHWQTLQLIESETGLRELSIRDPLTGLFNRRYLEETLTLEMIRAARKQHPIGVIMVDIDHFKRINDIHGHAAGDAVLVRMGNFLLTHVRLSDLICRYGGEEFILVLPDATRKITQMRAEQIREDIRHIHMQYEGQILEALTLSLGVAVFPEHGSTYDEILRAVDAALYRAKRDGRDRVSVAD
jgi:diguanylate cyclase (GGDEF)-like protein